MYFPNKEDYSLLFQRKLEILLKIEVLNDDGTLCDEFISVISGSSSISGSSAAKRTFNLTLIPSDKQSIGISERSLIWIDKDVRCYVGLKNQRNQEYVWYKQGCFVYQSANGTFDATTNQLSISCADYFTKLDGTVNGAIGGATSTKIRIYNKDENGNKIYKTIKQSIIDILNYANVKDYFVDEIGGYKGVPRYNKNYAEYRQANPMWNIVPYDLEISSGSTYGDILKQLLELYPNNDGSFDENGVYIAQMTPSLYTDEVVLTDNDIKKIFISESNSCDMTKVRNICEVWGATLYSEFYSDEVTLSGNVYSTDIDEYTEYVLYDTVALKIPNIIDSQLYINLNNLGDIPVYDEATELPLEYTCLEAGKTYVFKYKSRYIDGEAVYRFYLQGQYQVHALNVLSSGILGESVTVYGLTCRKYSEEYFKAKYNCKNVLITVVPDSPFTVQAIGERLNVETYDKISYDSLALNQAEYDNWTTCRLTDSITITTTIIPWLSDNMKISYVKANTNEEKQYIIQEVSHDYSSVQTTFTAYTFYELHQN